MGYWTAQLWKISQSVGSVQMLTKAAIIWDKDIISFCKISQMRIPRVLRQWINQLEGPEVAQAPAKMETWQLGQCRQKEKKQQWIKD